MMSRYILRQAAGGFRFHLDTHNAHTTDKKWKYMRFSKMLENADGMFVSNAMVRANML